ncbi:2-hydroxyacyl-CoA dehydratase family protein [Sphingomonas glaciei]|uniref:2-hydroxyacyl-CoA dehydratase family protein n=1 Tax=Sphingomonas glaciei TaxID=2938948 RepID=A0ABY5MQS2_9SPHN|nr:2-hydroxyacyl-CoA dehydratase family protein [Sphingomonas glaciei]UUR06845.1 2-hydroxyacyl-CoA dehydratase family protein [Sphingomonas glaciei]
MVEALRRLVHACDHPGEIADELRGQGRRVVRVLGQDAPYALLRAHGLAPVRMVPRPGPTPEADALAGAGLLSQRGQSLLQQIAADTSGDPILFTRADSDLPQIFAAVRELIRQGDLPPRPIHLLDLLHLPRPSSRSYNERRLVQLGEWLDGLGGRTEDGALAREAAAERARAATVEPLAGVARIAAIGAAHALKPEAWARAVAALAESHPNGRRTFVLGSPQFSTARQREFEKQQFVTVADDQDWGDPLLAAWSGSPDTLAGLADPSRLAPRMLVRVEDRLASVLERMAELHLDHVLIVQSHGEEATAWDSGFLRDGLKAAGHKVEVIGDFTDTPPPSLDAPRPARAGGQRSRKSLASIASFGSFQRGWFGEIRDAAARGEPLAVVNANSPQEVLRAMGIPFVVNQWWASIVAAKQQSGRYFGLLQNHGYPSDVEAYSAQGIASAFDTSETEAPWGGLPRPAFVQAVLGTDATPRIFDHWSRETGADLFLFERSAETRQDFPIDWWDSLQDRWQETIEPERLDLMTAELHALIERMEAASGHRFDPDRFAEIMELVNEQEDYYRRTRDLIASAPRAPVSISDTMPATMVPQWHRGTVWARDAARSFYEEVAARDAAGDVPCADEKLRLMWIGRGMWSDMGFYQRWEESHGAVFVWSMYLALAADGYIRRSAPGQDPLRALAARFVTMGDELRMPTWAGAWHVKEAETHRVDGAIALSDADPFVLRALRRAGVPVLALDLDNYNQESSDAADVDARIVAFLEGEVTHYRARR